jgi:Tc5 transposase DNA-binding domain
VYRFGGGQELLTHASVGVRATLRTVPPLAHQNTKISKSSNYHNSTKMGSIEEAIADLKSQEHPNITATAKKHGCNRTTLSKRYNGIQGSRQAGYNSQRLLTPAQLKALIKYINQLTERGLPPTTSMVRNFAAEIAGREPGPHWVSRWLKTNQNDLRTGYLTPINGARKKAESAFYYSLYFKLLERKIDEYYILPEN